MNIVDRDITLITNGSKHVDMANAEWLVPVTQKRILHVAGIISLMIMPSFECSINGRIV